MNWLGVSLKTKTQKNKKELAWGAESADTYQIFVMCLNFNGSSI